MSETEPGDATSGASPDQHRRRLRWLIGGGVVAAVVLVLAGFGIWYQFFRDDAPDAVTLEAAVEVVGSSTTSPAAAGGGYGGYAVAPGTSGAAEGTGSETTSAGDDAGGAASGADTDAGTAPGLDGTWSIDTSIGFFDEFTSTFVGYRVDEELASIGAKTAVGRTPAVTGSIDIEGTSITAAGFEADPTQLQSDDNRRDGAIRTQAIETNEFPTATFVLTETIELAAVPENGESVDLAATGELTIHGVTNTVEFPMQGQLVDDVIARQMVVESDQTAW